MRRLVTGGRVYGGLIVLCLVVGSIGFAGPNGPFGAPPLESYLALSARDRAEYVAALPRLSSPSHVPTHAAGACYYLSPEGLADLRAAADALLRRRGEYSRLLSLGRSGTGILTYARGFLFASGESAAAWDDIPFSFRDRWSPITVEERGALRRHFARNGLSPAALAGAARPVLFYDFVYSGLGSITLLEELMKWAADEGLVDSVKSKVHFLGFYSGAMIARQQLMSIYSASVKEMAWMGMRPEPPSERDIAEQARRVELPARDRYASLVSVVHSQRISPSFYFYAGTHGPNAHESFTREHWQRSEVSGEPTPEFAGHSGDPAFLELFFLYEQAALDARAKCVEATVRYAQQQ